MTNFHLRIDNIGGNCPVQAEGVIEDERTFKSYPFYFRSRWDRGRMGIGEDPVGIVIGTNPGWHKGEIYIDPPMAGYMPLDEAERLIRECAEEFLRENAGA